MNTPTLIIPFIKILHVWMSLKLCPAHFWCSFSIFGFLWSFKVQKTQKNECLFFWHREHIFLSPWKWAIPKKRSPSLYFMSNVGIVKLKLFWNSFSISRFFWSLKVLKIQKNWVSIFLTPRTYFSGPLKMGDPQK